MDAKCCDRCKKFYIPEKFKSDKKYTDGRPIKSIGFRTHGIYGEADLCTECAESFRDWLGREITCLK